MNLIDKLGLIGLLLAIFITLIGITGYVMNILKLISCDWIVSSEEIFRSIGIIIPIIGAVLGFVGHF